MKMINAFIFLAAFSVVLFFRIADAVAQGNKSQEERSTSGLMTEHLESLQVLG